MKYSLLLLLALSVNVNAQKIKSNAVPSEIRNAFKKAFPTAKVAWEKEKNGDYEGEFELDNKGASAIFATTGHLKELEVEIKTSELPQAALDYLKQNYPREKIKEAAQITDDKGVITYEAEIKKNGKSADIIFDAKGKFIK